MFTILRNINLLKKTSPFKFSKYNFLSNAYNLEQDYIARLDNKLIKKIQPSTMYLELDQQYNRHKKLHAIDIDLYVNSITDDVNTEELEDILYKMRLTPSSIDMMDSTQHAVIRLYLQLNKIEQLINILDDRINYGIFPDSYCNNLLINNLIKENNYKAATKVATFQMLQEDFSNDITKYLSLYSCMKYLENPTNWYDEEQEEVKEEAEEDEEEEVKIRVKYLRNEYNDNHFDLRTPNDLIGKTLMTIGRLDNDVLSKSYYLIGLGLMKKFDETESFLNQIENDNFKVCKNSLELFKKHLVSDDIGKVVETTDKTNETKTDESKNLVDENVQNILNKVDKIAGLATDDNLLEITESKLKLVIQKFEKDEIENQKQAYKEWDSRREVILKKHLEEMKEAEIFDNINKKKLELDQEEEKLFFFDNEDKIDLMLEKKYPKPPVVVVKKRNEFDGKRNLGRNPVAKSKKRLVDDNYIPPDLHKPYENQS